MRIESQVAVGQSNEEAETTDLDCMEQQTEILYHQQAIRKKADDKAAANKVNKKDCGLNIRVQAEISVNFGIRMPSLCRIL